LTVIPAQAGIQGKLCYEGLTYFTYRKEKIKVCGFMDWIYRREKAGIAGAIIISGIITEGLFSHSSRLHDFPNHFSILLQLSVIFLVLL